MTVTGGTITCQSPAQPQSFCYGTALSADDASSVMVSGGTIAGGQFGPALATEISGAILVSGGTITSGKYGPALVPAGSGMITLMGGKITANRKFEGMIAGGANGTVNLFSQGTPFLVNGKTLNNTSLATNAFGTLTGTLADGHPIDIEFLNGGHILLNVGRPPTILRTGQVSLTHPPP